MKQNPTCAICTQEMLPNIAHFCNGPIFNPLQPSWLDLKTKSEMEYIIGYLEGIKIGIVYQDIREALAKPIDMLKKIVGHE